MNYGKAKTLIREIQTHLNSLPNLEHVDPAVTAELTKHPIWEIKPSSFYDDNYWQEPPNDSPNYSCQGWWVRGRIMVWYRIDTRSYRRKGEAVVLNVSADRPNEPYVYLYNPSSAESRLSLAKTPERLAKDIQRKIVPTALELFSAWQRAIDKQNKYRNSVEEVARKVLEGLPAGFEFVAKGTPLSEYRKADSDYLEVPGALLKSGCLIHRAPEVGDAQIRFDALYLPPEIANRLLKMLVES